LLALGPIGWRAGWWHFRFSLLTLMPWAAYFGLAAVVVAVLALGIGLSRLDWRAIALALVALIGGGLIAYVPWHYDQIRQTVPSIHDITTDPDNPPPFVAVVPLRQGEGINSVAYQGAKVAEQQRQAYPDVVPLTIGLAPDVAFARALDTAQRLGWTVVASDKAAGRIEASQRSRWMGFTDDIIVRVTPAAASTYARLRAMGAVISALMRPAFAITSRRCVRPQPAKVSARPSSLTVLLPDARDCRWQNYWPVAPRGNCPEPAAGFSGVEAPKSHRSGAYLLITAVPDGVLLSSDSNAYPLIFREHRQAERDIPQGSLLTHRWREMDSDHWSRQFGEAFAPVIFARAVFPF
jgi:Protein of unknown function (DUF1499)